MFNVPGAAMVKELDWDRSTLSNGLLIHTGLAGVSVVVLGHLTADGARGFRPLL